MGLVYVFLTILLTVCGNLIIKWQVMQLGALPENWSNRLLFFVNLLLNPWVITGLVAAFFAFITWVLAMTKLELSYAYPFVGFSFVLVLLGGMVFFHESLSWQKVIGVLFIIIGVFISSRSL